MPAPRPPPIPREPALSIPQRQQRDTRTALRHAATLAPSLASPKYEIASSLAHAPLIHPFLPRHCRGDRSCPHPEPPPQPFTLSHPTPPPSLLLTQTTPHTSLSLPPTQTPHPSHPPYPRIGGAAAADERERGRGGSTHTYALVPIWRGGLSLSLVYARVGEWGWGGSPSSSSSSLPHQTPLPSHTAAAIPIHHGRTQIPFLL